MCDTRIDTKPKHTDRFLITIIVRGKAWVVIIKKLLQDSIIVLVVGRNG
jgi:hypothetical protein